MSLTAWLIIVPCNTNSYFVHWSKLYIIFFVWNSFTVGPFDLVSVLTTDYSIETSFSLTSNFNVCWTTVIKKRKQSQERYRDEHMITRNELLQSGMSSSHVCCCCTHHYWRLVVEPCIRNGLLDTIILPVSAGYVLRANSGYSLESSPAVWQFSRFVDRTRFNTTHAALIWFESHVMLRRHYAANRPFDFAAA